MKINEISILLLVIGIIALVAVKLWRPILQRFGAFDIPNHRSSHSRPTVRGGGVGALTGQIIAAIAILAFFDSGRPKNLLLTIFFFAILIGVVGLFEDIIGLSSLIRAGLQILLGFSFAVVTSFQIEIGWEWIVIAPILIAANVNFVNFMDGLNGMSGLFALVFGISYFLIGYLESSYWLMLGGGVIAVTFGSFLYWNLTPPGVFLGDVGSYLLGGGTILLFTAGVWSGINPLLLFAPLSIYWIDTVYTLFNRGVKREPIFEAHRSHVYQRIAQLGFSHVKVSFLVAILSVITTVTALVTTLTSQVINVAGILIIVAIWIFYLYLPKILKSRKAVQ